ncbi:glycosyltransferase family 2 protein [Vibrio breoganii]|uniref:glycosyltransferase family 2 protein n=1 Tax=Vibrio breoganii TaxID=553239 RepID=UPI000C84403C|nr:glycosyltransferase [Vibrio breoganii]PMG83491.1 hypothetical protein BCU81_15015 [Vibrio breoganii]
MNKIYISIISHGHDELLLENDSLKLYQNFPNVFVVIVDNISSEKLEKYCNSIGVHYLANKNRKGFGANNNNAYSHCLNLGMEENDYFVVHNPDVFFNSDSLSLLFNTLSNSTIGIGTIKLYKDRECRNIENSIRYFPTVYDIFKGFLGRQVTRTYEVDNLVDSEEVEWCSGALMVIKSRLYSKLDGFDERYFMYYEDVDLCYRARSSLNEQVNFIKGPVACHVGAYNNRKLFSKHFWWYIKSLFRFLITSSGKIER